MGFGEAIRVCFGKYVDFSGRARRSEYWYFYLFCFLAGLVASVLDRIIVGSTGVSSLRPISAMLNLAFLLPSLAVTVRRLHDTNRSGWLLLGAFGYIIVAAIVYFAILATLRGASGALMLAVVLGLGALAYGIFLLVCMVQNGTAGQNAYGPDPKGPDVAVFS
jgi:uncharacterized membrane protein YhaH (DUF805 family)